MLNYFLLGLALGFPAAAQPGPLQAYLLSETLRSGCRRTLPAALAPLISDGPIVILVLLLLSQTPAWLLDLLRLGGGVFILYLAWGAFRSFQRADGSQAGVPVQSSQQGVLKAALLNILNPNPYIFWATVAGPIIIDAWRGSPNWALGFGLGFYGTLIAGFAGFIVLFAVAGRLDDRLSRALSGVSAVALLLFGLYQFWLVFI